MVNSASDQFISATIDMLTSDSAICCLKSSIFRRIRKTFQTPNSNAKYYLHSASWFVILQRLLTSATRYWHKKNFCFANPESHLNWQAIFVQFGRNRDYETHPDKLITFGWLQFGDASLIRQIPSFASPCELLVSIFRSLWLRSFT